MTGFQLLNWLLLLTIIGGFSLARSNGDGFCEEDNCKSLKIGENITE